MRVMPKRNYKQNFTNASKTNILKPQNKNQSHESFFENPPEKKENSSCEKYHKKELYDLESSIVEQFLCKTKNIQKEICYICKKRI